MNKVALVTVNYGGKNDTLELIDSVKNLDTDGLDFKFIVVDATAGEWIGDSVKGKPSYLEFLQAGENKGFAGNYNVGMRYAVAWGADYILIINNDTLLGDKQLIKKLKEALDNNPEALAISPKIYFAPGYEFHKKRYKKEDIGKVIWYAGGKFDWANMQSIHRGIDRVDNDNFNKIEPTDFVSGACLLIRKPVLEKYGYFDENLFAYFEDNDWQRKILKSGGKLYYHGGTYIYHKVSRTAGIGSEITDYLLTRNRLSFTFKHAGLRTIFAVLREALRHLFTGRKAQKRGVVDFFIGRFGPPPYLKKDSGYYKYPIRLSVLVANYKTLDLTEKLIKSVLDKDSGFDSAKDEIIVLDDASGEDFGRLTKKYPGVRFLSNEINKGYVASNNRLIDIARGEMLLLLNSDIEVQKNSLSVLIKGSLERGGGSVSVGQLVFPDGRAQDSCFKLPTFWGAIKEYFFGIKGSYFMFKPDTNKPVRVEGAVMASFLIPRNVINKVGRLNEKLFMYFEDIDYCRRLKTEGVPIYFYPEAKFYHHHGASSQKAGGLGEELVKSSKIYHGLFRYYILTFALWAGQKWKKIFN